MQEEKEKKGDRKETACLWLGWAVVRGVREENIQDTRTNNYFAVTKYRV